MVQAEADVAEGFDLLCGVVDFAGTTADEDTTVDDGDTQRTSATTHPGFRRGGRARSAPRDADMHTTRACNRDGTCLSANRISDREQEPQTVSSTPFEDAESTSSGHDLVSTGQDSTQSVGDDLIDAHQDASYAALVAEGALTWEDVENIKARKQFREDAEVNRQIIKMEMWRHDPSCTEIGTLPRYVRATPHARRMHAARRCAPRIRGRAERAEPKGCGDRVAGGGTD